MQPATWQLLVAALHVSLAVGVSAHIVLTKTDVRSAIGWTGLVWLTPILGSALYATFGVNRIRRVAGRIRRPATAQAPIRNPGEAVATSLAMTDAPHLQSLATLVGTVTGAPLSAGNSIDPLINGDEAYPAMLAAIDAATQTVALATYIFDRGVVGGEFVDALARAVERGVIVRVLIDGVGARYSRPPITHTLKARGVRVAQFLPSMLPVHPYINLRNHRKLLVVDGTVAFCGGLNIRDGCMLSLAPKDPTLDTHFRVTGPVVRDLMRALAFDWQFVTGESLAGPTWFPTLSPTGAVFARGIPDGPDENFEALLLTILAAISQARNSVRIMTPYFLPDMTLLDALRVAAMRGVDIEIVLPVHGNLRLVQWAMTAQLAQVVRAGCRVLLSPAPFDHSKLLVIDGEWSLIGSANWDPRSLRLNFEYDVECYSAAFAARLNAMIDAKARSAGRLSIAELDGHSLLRKLRDGTAWLAQPYL